LEVAREIGGQAYNFAPGAEIKDTITAGASVKLHFMTNADGTLSVTEVEIADPTKIEDNDANVNDDHRGTSTDDHGSGSNGGGDNSGGNTGSGDNVSNVLV